MSWQPASTIPKDGTVIVVFCLYDVTSPIFWGEMEWQGKTIEAWFCVDGTCYTDGDFTDVIGWMAMPEFPDLVEFYEKLGKLYVKKEEKED